MRRPVLTISAIALGVVVLLLAAVAIVVATLDANRLVAPLVEHVRSATGRDFQVRGGADLTVSLEPRLRLRDVTLGSATGTGRPPMATAREVDVKVALLPLLRRRVEVVRLTLVEPHIALETDRSGRGNWEFGAAADATPPVGTAAPSSAFAFGVGEFAIERGTLVHRDERGGDPTRIEIERLLVRAHDLRTPIRADFTGRVQGVPMAVEGTAAAGEAMFDRKVPIPVTLKGELGGKQLDARGKVTAAGHGAVELRELAVVIGSTRMSGSVSAERKGEQSSYRFDLASPVLHVADVRVAAAIASTKDAGTASRSSKGAHLFSDTPVPLDALRGPHAAGTVAIDRLVLEGGREIADLRATMSLRDGRLDVAPLSASMMGGKLSGTLRADATAGRPPVVSVALRGQGLDLAKLLATFNVPNEVRGGKTELTIDLRMTGTSPRAWASSAQGSVIASVGPAQVPQLERGLPPALVEALNALNPFRGSEAITDLRCAVVRLPLAAGVARIDRSIAVETAKIGVSASGTVDFRNETLDLSLRPAMRASVSVDVAQLAGLVRLQGPLASPAVRIDPLGTAEAIARIGAAVGTGGWSEIGRSLLGSMQQRAEGGECAIALGRARPQGTPPGSMPAPAKPQGRPSGSQPAPARPAPDRPPATDPIDEIGRMLQGLQRK